MGDAIWDGCDFHVFQMKDGVYDLVFLRDSSRYGITLPRFGLIAPDLTDQVPHWEFHWQVVSGDDRSEGVQGWSTNYSVICRGLVDEQAVDHLGELRREQAKGYWQLDGAFSVDLLSPNPYSGVLIGLIVVHSTFI